MEYSSTSFELEDVDVEDDEEFKITSFIHWIEYNLLSSVLEKLYYRIHLFLLIDIKSINQVSEKLVEHVEERALEVLLRSCNVAL